MRALAATSALLVVLPTAALAHSGAVSGAGFSHGLLHPLGGADHVLAMLAVGLLAFVLSGRALLLVPLSFVAMMVVGFLLGRAGMPLPGIELGIALSSLVIGALATLSRAIPLSVAMGTAGLFAVFHGHAHGAEIPVAADALAYALGFVAATGLLHAGAIVVALAASRLGGRAGPSLLRTAGAAVALGGVGVLAGWL